MSDKIVHEKVQDYYGKSFVKPNPLECSFAKETTGKLNYLKEIEGKLNEEMLKHNYGCGCTIPNGDLSGFTVLDLGSGSGRDCFVISALVGNSGKVIGIDMTEEALTLSNKYKPFHMKAYGITDENVVEFRKGIMEDLGKSKVGDNSVDAVVSNCVVNLSPNKKKVFSEVHRVLREGGEMYFSDVYVNLRIPEEFQKDKTLWSGCLSGSMYVNDFEMLLKEIGFSGVRIVEAKILQKGSVFDLMEKKDFEELKKKKEVYEKLQKIQPLFYSLTVRAAKLPKGTVEPGEEDYGQTVTFKGDKYSEVFTFDVSNEFKKGVPTRVSSNTYNWLKFSKYAKFFEFGEKKLHQGRYKSQKGLWEILDEAEGEYDKNPVSCKSCEKGCC